MVPRLVSCDARLRRRNARAASLRGAVRRDQRRVHARRANHSAGQAMRYSRQNMFRCLLIASTACTACAHAYRPPTHEEPHALIKLRRVYQVAPGTHRNEVVSLLPRFVLFEVTRPAHTGPITDSVRLRPGPAKIRFTSRFFHHETRNVRQSYTAHESYTTTQTYSCGTSTQPRTCFRPVTRSRPVTRYRTVTKQVQVTDAACDSGTAHAFEAKRVYILQTLFQGHERCSLRCYEQIYRGNDFILSPCGVPVPGGPRPLTTDFSGK